MWLAAQRQWAYEQRRVLVYGLGACIVSIWTLLRFFTQRTIFDLVSQQVIVHQWLHGAISTAHMGQTAYVPKMLLLYVPLDLLPGSPRLKLILLTLVINIATFVLIGVIIEKILREYKVRIGPAFYTALLWLSVVAGSVFWIEFANSRNLEVAGGLLWIYLGLRYLRLPSWRRGLALMLLGGVLFFDDPLQLYMSALPLVVYGAVMAAARQERARAVVWLCGTTVLAFGLAQLLFVVAGRWLQLTFHDTGGSTLQLSLSWLQHSVQGTVRAIVSLLAGAADAGRVREIGNLGLVLLGGALFVWAVVRRSVPGRLAVLAACIIIVDVAVYIAGSQAVQGAATARYLIMLAPVVVIALSAVHIPKKVRFFAVALTMGVLGVNIIALGAGLGRHWDTSFPKDVALENTYGYLLHHPETHIYASTDTAMPLLYLHSLPASRILPVGCLGGNLVQTHFSMDAAFAQNEHAAGGTAAIVFDGGTITNTPNTCTIASVANQLGKPMLQTLTDNGSLVLLYRQSQVRLPH